MGVFVKKDHCERVSRMMKHALTLGNDASVWDGFTLILSTGLSGFERAAMFSSVARSLHPEDRRFVLGEIERREGAGMPLPPIYDPMNDATWWASIASIEERKAVLVAAFQSLPTREQNAFLVSAGRRDAA